MSQDLNEFQQPVGQRLTNWSPPAWPAGETQRGRYCRLELLSADVHGDGLYSAITCQPDDPSWTYMPYGPFRTRDEYQQWLLQYAGKHDPQFYAIIDESSQRPVGVASYLRVMPASGSIEVGHIHYSPQLRRARAATEAMLLMMRHAFSLGFRRYEWKCNTLNAQSQAAARRLGFTYEGTFRQATVVKGRNRDTAWFAMMDYEWPIVEKEIQRWLEPKNFDEHGQQRTRLDVQSHLRA